MKATDTKSQILAAAIELFALNGYEKTTMREIAGKVCIRSASIYYFFDSKESLLENIFVEFERNFAKYRNPPEAIFEAAKVKPLSEVLSMIFYTFGDAAERSRMMAISRVVLSLEYENTKAMELYYRVVMQDSTDYGVAVLKGLYDMGIIRKVDFKWVVFMLYAFAVALFEEYLRHLDTYTEVKQEYEEGIRFISSKLADIVKP